MGLLELQQGQKFKKQGCWNSSKPKNEKNGAAGTPARAKNQKIGRREIPEPEKLKSWPSGNSGARKIKKLAVGKFRSPKNQKIGCREIPQAQKIKK